VDRFLAFLYLDRYLVPLCFALPAVEATNSSFGASTIRRLDLT